MEIDIPVRMCIKEEFPRPGTKPLKNVMLKLKIIDVQLDTTTMITNKPDLIIEKHSEKRFTKTPAVLS